MSELPVGQPRPTPETERFFTAAAEGRLELPVCNACDLVIWYPRSFCPDCQTSEVTWTPMSGSGTVYSYTVTRGGVGGRWRAHLPFVVAYVQLDEGPIVLTNLVDTDPDAVHVDQRVSVVFDRSEPDEEGSVHAVMRFTGSD